MYRKATTLKKLRISARESKGTNQFKSPFSFLWGWLSLFSLELCVECWILIDKVNFSIIELKVECCARASAGHNSHRPTIRVTRLFNFLTGSRVNFGGRRGVRRGGFREGMNPLTPLCPPMNFLLDHCNLFTNSCWIWKFQKNLYG